MGDAGFVVIWKRVSAPNTLSETADIVGVRFDSIGNKVSDEFNIQSHAHRNAISPAVTSIGATGKFISTFSRDNFLEGLPASVLFVGSNADLDKTNTFDTSLSEHPQTNPDIVSLRERFAIVWESTKRIELPGQTRLDTDIVGRIFPNLDIINRSWTPSIPPLAPPVLPSVSASTFKFSPSASPFFSDDSGNPTPPDEKPDSPPVITDPTDTDSASASRSLSVSMSSSASPSQQFSESLSSSLSATPMNSLRSNSPSLNPIANIPFSGTLSPENRIEVERESKRITATAGSDRFIFRPMPDATHTIIEFDPTHDRIDLSSINGVYQLSAPSLTGSSTRRLLSSDVVISLPGNQTIILENIQLTDLSESQFIFAAKPHHSESNNTLWIILGASGGGGPTFNTLSGLH